MRPIRPIGPMPLLITAVLLCMAAPAIAQDRTDPPPRYREAVESLRGWIAREVEAKKLPALSIALVDDQEVVWAEGFGDADPTAGTPATARTLYRVGSVSKPFTALLLMLLVELGMIDLDAPVTRYVPDFRPKNQFSKDITLRQILAHRSGLLRESPVGNYFDDTGPTLAATVLSLNGRELVYAPESKTSYSNAALALAGYAAERVAKKDFADLMKGRVLAPLGMDDSTFAPTPEQRKRVASSVMWTYHGREFPAPTFDLGMAPAGSLYASANDMGKFLKFLFAGGRGPKGQLLKRETLESMWKPAYAKAGEKTGFGVGFALAEFEGKRRVGHGGAVYGFATELAALPDEKLGVFVSASRDVSNAITRRIAETALRHMLAVRAGKPLPPVTVTEPLARSAARKLEGRYESGDKTVELTESAGRLWLMPLHVGMRADVRRDGKGLVTDGYLSSGLRLEAKGDTLKVGDTEYRRAAPPKPGPVPQKWAGLIGEYGWDHNVLYILEKDGKLYTLIEWVFLYPLTEVSPDEYRFPDFGLYHGDRVVFKRDASGRATEVEAGSVVFKRRPIAGEDGKTFTITPVRPLDQLRKEALAARPPAEKGTFRKPDLVDVAALDPTIKLDVRYAGTDNFLGTPSYTSAKAYLQRPAAEALLRVHRGLAKEGYGLLIHDAYRPWHVTKMFFDATPTKYRGFVANPAKGSRHNRGCAVDLTLYDLKTGKAVEMVSGYDEFTDRAYPDYPGGTSLQRRRRDLLRRAMEAEGFTVFPAEWWHFDYRDWREYPILNLTFEAVGKSAP